MKKLTLIVVLSLMLVGYKGDSSKENAKAEKERLEKEHQATAQKIKALCSQYNAVMDWTQSLEKVWHPFTIELENALIRVDNRPVLLLGEVKNITKESDKYWVHFTQEAPYTDFDIHFFLRCTPEHVKEIMSHRDSSQDYAVIAQVSEVKKVSYLFATHNELVFNAEDFERGSREVTIIDIDPLSDLFIARGTCSDLLFLGDNRLSLYKLNDLLSGK
jgi:hypothetical protein